MWGWERPLKHPWNRNGRLKTGKKRPMSEVLVVECTLNGNVHVGGDDIGEPQLANEAISNPEISVAPIPPSPPPAPYFEKIRMM